MEMLRVSMSEAQLKHIVEMGGGEWLGLATKPEAPRDLVYFNDPVTHGTLVLAPDRVTVENVRNHLKEKRWSCKAVKASLVSAVETLKKDMDALQTNIISFKDILWWCEQHGSDHSISRYDAEAVADMLEGKGIRVKY